MRIQYIHTSLVLVAVAVAVVAVVVVVVVVVVVAVAVVVVVLSLLKLPEAITTRSLSVCMRQANNSIPV